ncbi:hypothetical protein HG15A2_43970 [Adhaeretor mobilis]|uniref:Uncharacterized protein n=1 Tax=Adhaeretor mobilis TaxID=1930276 RepID=A0A517N1P9_9BACT|nr:hypothetical protein HG15A2_43970 [Adhaeretor mobilis]
MIEGIDAVVELPEVEAELPLAKIYEGVQFATELEDNPLS